MKVRKAILGIVAAFSLAAAGLAAAHGRSDGWYGKPSTTPPPWSHGDNGRGHDRGHHHGFEHEHGHGYDH